MAKDVDSETGRGWLSAPLQGDLGTPWRNAEKARFRDGTTGRQREISPAVTPSGLERRIGRIKRLGPARDRVDMLNLVYNDTHDEKVYEAPSGRTRDRYDLFGSLPDTIEDGWIEDIEHLDDYLSRFIERRANANAFLRYGSTVEPKGPGWELCERVLGRRKVIERRSEGW
jgi:hypothetical protein